MDNFEVNYRLPWDLGFEYEQREYIQRLKDRFKGFKKMTVKNILICLGENARRLSTDDTYNKEIFMRRYRDQDKW